MAPLKKMRFDSCKFYNLAIKSIRDELYTCLFKGNCEYQIDMGESLNHPMCSQALYSNQNLIAILQRR
ncbi:hypothetical protein KO465_03965 [Candidatus Micrarchaeota archaeon]|jgi:hypothetical protein|nr:hypothetical protein [Candidatus Micrarchaeota archaeon]